MPDRSEGEAAEVEAVADGVWAHVVATRPYFALRAGASIERLPHGTLEEAERDAALGLAVSERLRALDFGQLGPRDRGTAALLRYLADEWICGVDSWWWQFPVAPYQAGDVAVAWRQVFDSVDFDDAAAVERHVSLAADIAGWVRAAKHKVARQVERGWGLPREALAGFVAAVRGQRVGVSELLAVDDARLAPLSAARRGSLVDGVERVLTRDILPAFDELLDHLTGPAKQTAVAGVGLGQYPGGEDAYRHLVRSYATFDITPEEVHRIGLEQVAELTERLAEVRAEVGFDGDESAYRRIVEADPRFHARSADDVAATYQKHLGAIEPLVEQWFSVIPRAPYGVERLDAALEEGMSYGYYEAPTPQRPVGRYRYNGSGLDSRSQINAATLVCHELVPGHHFHLARQAEDTSLHPIRAEFAPQLLPAYTEGWAEYAASLGAEMGLYSDPWDRYGYYLHQRFMAQRLVVDTGLNAFGWPLDEARAYMTATTVESAEQVRTETLRYSTDLPAQALGYRLCYLKLWELRRRAEDALGAAFDVRDFHEAVLGAGALPLTAVEDNVIRFAEGVGTDMS